VKTPDLLSPGRPAKPSQLRQGNLVPPAQFNVWEADTYKTAPAPARAGSDDHKRVASRGVRC